jgi:tRNA dimethylallyltransferase
VNWIAGFAEHSVSRPEMHNKQAIGNIHIPVIVGPTGVGKTEVSLEVANELQGEIISADSRQIFKGMDIGTAKPSPRQRSRIPHHFVDELAPGERFSAGEFGKQASRAIQDIIANGRIPIVVGGSGLYIRAVMDGFFDGKNWDATIRKELSDRADREGLQALYQEVIARDPDAGHTIMPTDRKRILRALEIMELTGQPMTAVWRSKKTKIPYEGIWCGITMPRLDLNSRINIRVLEMMEKGLVDEVRTLLANQVDPASNAMASVGYTEVVQYLKGEMHLDDMVELIQRNSRRYAKRQMTWFKRNSRIHWFERKANQSVVSIARQIVKHIRESMADSVKP